MTEAGAGEARKASAIEFEGVTPILRVGSLAASIEYYVKVLGFKVDWQDPGIMVSVSRGRCHIMLCEGDQGHAGGWVWIGVDAIEPLLEEYRAAGAKVKTGEETMAPPPYFSQVFILKIVKVLCFDTDLQVFILKIVSLIHRLTSSACK